MAIEEKWDVETIVSTYSNLDNHPGVLRVDSNKNRKPKSKVCLAAIPDMETESTKLEEPIIKEQIKLSRHVYTLTSLCHRHAVCDEPPF